MKLPKWKLKLMKDLIKGKVTLVKTRMGYQYKPKTKMSQKKRNKAIRDKYSMTAKEAEAQGLIPKDFHLFDGIEMKEYQAQFDGYKEWERKIKEREDKAGPMPD